MIIKVDDVFNDDIKHEQRLMGNEVLSVQRHDFQDAPLWYCRVYEIRMCEFGVFSKGITSIANFNKTQPAVLYLIIAYRRISRTVMSAEDHGGGWRQLRYTS
jgi:hypothetical protein